MSCVRCSLKIDERNFGIRILNFIASDVNERDSFLRIARVFDLFIYFIYTYVRDEYICTDIYEYVGDWRTRTRPAHREKTLFFSFSNNNTQIRQN